MSGKGVDFSRMADADRVAMAERIFIKYPRLKEILGKVADCHRNAKLAAEPPCLFVTGPTGAGKTTISRYFRENHPRRASEEGTVVPVLTATIPSPASVKSLATSLLDSLGDPIPDKGSTVSQTYRLYKLMSKCEVELVILDEFQHIIDRERLKVLNTAADWLKNLVNHTGKPMVLMGMPGADKILDANDQLERRFSSRMTLEPFGWGTKASEDDFRRFLQVLDENLPFNARSQLASWETALRIHYATGGVVGNVMAVVRTATGKAVREGVERIELDHLAKAYEEKWGIAERLRQGDKYANPFEAAPGKLTEAPPSSKSVREPGTAIGRRRSKRDLAGILGGLGKKSIGNLLVTPIGS